MTPLATRIEELGEVAQIQTNSVELSTIARMEDGGKAWIMSRYALPHLLALVKAGKEFRGAVALEFGEAAVADWDAAVDAWEAAP